MHYIKMSRQDLSNTKAFKVLLKDKNGIGCNPKFAGVAVPVFSLKSNDSFGIGDFNDLKHLSDWCHKVGIKIIQILPINDTRTDNSWDNSYPYKAISTKALHPIYLNLHMMGRLEDENDMDYFKRQKDLLNAKDFVDYPEVMKIKDKFFKKIFSQTWDKVSNSNDYNIFFENNKEWLVPYAYFCSQQPAANSRQHELYYFLQYHLDKQLMDAVEYMHQKGIILKGDIPIGIGRHSVEAWTSPHLFNIDSQAGAPPDSFAAEGQNWGFPTYNWEAMAQDNYKWWRERLTQMSRYFDAYRIDHILGFFRIWEIPYESTQGLLGHFSPAIGYRQQDICRLMSIDKERLTKPYIRGHFLHEYFGDFTTEVREKYLNETSFSYFELKPEFDTQRKISDYFSNNYTVISEKEHTIRNGLLSLAAEVLFMTDKNKEDIIHPRIALQFTHSYNELDSCQKDEINKLYDEYYYHRNNEFWKEEALKKLPKIIESSDMLVCGEDLGMVPACVPEVMQQLNILSLEVQRMPKNPNETFVNPKNNPYLSVSTTSTHDTSTLRGWWEENGELTNRFYREMLGHHDGAPYFAEPYICKEILEQHLHSSSMLTILPIQDYIAIDGEFRWDSTQREQINIPADPHHHWCYKMHQSLESLNERQDFNDSISKMIKDSGRN
ncbi:MAG: 4-alpha-glucanotransferase [Bacteroidales bacterium]|nr:4-alpha-glucanotransferase [Bacteroidales bacterium]